MALGNAIKGARHTPITITWKTGAGVAFDLSAAGATLTGTMVAVSPSGTSRAIDGALAFTGTGSDGEFTWTFGAVDVGTVGVFDVQFKCTYTDTTFDITKMATLEVLDVTAVAA